MATESEVVFVKLSVLQGGDIPVQIKNARKEIEAVLGTKFRVVILPTTGDTSIEIVHINLSGEPVVETVPDVELSKPKVLILG